MTKPTTIFISYARKDGRDLALKLKTSLESAGYDAWLDTSRIEGWDSWGKTIEEAIDARDVVLALMSPASYISEICRAEQLRALRKKKQVIPIRVSADADIPIWLEPVNYRDFSKSTDYDIALAQVIADLGDTSYKPPVMQDIFNNAPPLPPHFIPRLDEFNLLKDALLSGKTDRQVALTALRGLGGIGKSVLANAVCRDEFVSGAFPDGVFWVELGREPQDITGKMQVVGQGLGDKTGSYTSVDSAISSLRNILKHKSALIVLDDMWAESLKVAQYFIMASPRTRWLITTRDQKIVDSLSATPIVLGVMTPPQALALIREWTNRDDEAFPSIAEKLGYHPLALRIVGARLLDMTSAEWLENYEIARLKLDYDAEGRDDNIISCFQVSVDSLSKGLPPLYHALGIFPEDVWIPEDMVAILWRAINPSLSRTDCTDICIKLAKLALIDRQRDEKQIRMHDLLHDYNRYKIREHIADLQAQFITALGDLYRLPNDYAWRNIAYHLIGAKQGDVLRGLLLTYRWLNAKLRATDSAALLSDCDMWLVQGITNPARRGLPWQAPTPPTKQEGIYTFPTYTTTTPQKDETVHLIRSAIGMSAHVLDADEKALAHQLAGRLMHHYEEIDEISAFLDVVIQTPNNLFPLDLTSEYDIMSPAGGIMLRTLAGHTSSVINAIELRDGRLLSWSLDNTLRLWEADGTPVATLTGHTNYVRGAIELRDGRLLSWSLDNTLRLWDNEGHAITALAGHTGWVNGAIELRDGRLLSWSDDSTLRLWDKDGTLVATLTGHTGMVFGTAQLGDGRLLSWSEDATLRLWDNEGHAITALTGHTSRVNGAIELGDGRLLSWSDDATLRLWESDSTPVATLTGHTDKVWGAIELRDGRVLSWAGHDDFFENSEDVTLRLWDSEGHAIRVLTGHTGRVDGAIELGNGLILSWSDDATLRLWDRDGHAIRVLTGHTGKVDGAIQLDDGLILSWSNDATLRLWDSEGHAIATLTGHTWSVNGAIELGDGQILSWSSDNTLRLWDVDGHAITALTGHTGWVNGAIQLGNGRILSWSSDETLRLWDSEGHAITALTGHTGWVNGAIQLGNGRILSWGSDNTLRLWDKEGHGIAILTGHTGKVNGAIQLGDGRILSCSNDNTLRLWDSEGHAISVLTGHTGWVNGTIELGDGRILSWGSDNTLRLWDSEGHTIRALTGHTGWVNGAIELGDGRILSWGSDENLRLWGKEGHTISVLTGHTNYVRGAIELGSGQILSWSWGKTLRLWDADCTPIAMLEQDYSYSDRTIIGEWAKKHGYTLADFYPKEKAPLMAGGWVQDNGTHLIVYHPQTGKKIHTFHGDAPFSGNAVVLDGGRVVVAGDSAGRVLFLRWVGEDNNPITSL